MTEETTFLHAMRDPSPARLSDDAVRRALIGPPTLAAILLLVLNDHLLKGAGLLPGLVTGKLSDFAFLFFAPIVLVYATRARSRWAVVAAFALPAALFVAINVSLTASDAFAGALSAILPSTHVCDAEDLIALPMLAASWWYLWRRASAGVAEEAYGPRPLSHALVMIVAVLGCVATSSQPPEPIPMPPTHRAVYMSWEEFRTTAVQVKEPQPIGKRGKLLIVGNHLLVSEPRKGVHVFDNADPKNPRALMFIQIPGNIDIALRDDLLYADSFVDLLVFELDLPNAKATLVQRLKDQFKYDPYLTVASDTPMALESLDQKRGVVIGFEPLQRSAEVAK